MELEWIATITSLIAQHPKRVFISIVQTSAYTMGVATSPKSYASRIRRAEREGVMWWEFEHRIRNTEGAQQVVMSWDEDEDGGGVWLYALAPAGLHEYEVARLSPPPGGETVRTDGVLAVTPAQFRAALVSDAEWERTNE